MNQRRTKVSNLMQYLHKGNQTYAELELDPLLNSERLSKAMIVSMVTGLSKPLNSIPMSRLNCTENKNLLESSNKNYLSQFQVMLYLNQSIFS
jgi:hypothetical protein